ncbi:uncharacterized protein LOC131626708 [Vicia villosa]|uniref:uncharacterized protein LOC131626708 n=1 Tax=Vicia villosa TaxID=3911 RepID=UPI00273AF51F|nr:uncharacterized protein LOC131626708 [Vicia villosa]
MEQGPYFIYVKPLFMKYWSIDFELTTDLLRVLPLWITLSNLPLHLWGSKSISKITSAVGRPITTDECTTRKLRISYARVLVEVDITKPVKESVTIQGHNGKEWEQKIEYEWRSKYCQTCLKIGHDCSIKKGIGQQKQVQKFWKPATKPVTVAQKPENLAEEPFIESSEPYKATPEEAWTVIGTNKMDKAKKKIIFTPSNEMLVQNIFTPLGNGTILEWGGGGGAALSNDLNLECKGHHWNVRGINKEARHREVNSYFSTFKVPIIALLETRVKKDNASKIRRKFGNYWSYLDNYSHHHNGRIWLMWKDQEVIINMLQCEEQFLHVEVKNFDNKVLYYATIVYALTISSMGSN